MNLPSELSPTDGAIHKWCSAMIQAVSSYINFSTLAAAFPTNFSGSEGTLYLSGTLTTPPILCVYDLINRQLLIVGCGSESASQLAAVLSGYFANRVSPGNNQPPFATVADGIANDLAQPAGFRWSKIRYVGYSYGAAIVGNIPYQLGNWDSTTDYKVYLYGMPKPSRFADRNLFSPQNFRNVVRYDDPVPSFPYNLSRTRLPIWSICTTSEAQNMADWVQPCTLLTYAADGSFGSNYPGTQATGASAGAFNTFSAWIQAIFSESAHSFSSYAAFISQLPNAVIPSVQPATGPNPERRDIPTSSTVTQERVIQQIAQASIVQANPAGAATQAIAMVTPVQYAKWRAGKNLNHNALFYNDQFVVYVRRRRTLRGLVRKLNLLGISP